MNQKNHDKKGTGARSNLEKKDQLLHELMEAEIDSDAETTVVQDRRNETASGNDNNAIDIDIELPKSSDEEFLPIFAPPLTSPRLPRNTPAPSRKPSPGGKQHPTKSILDNELDSIFSESNNEFSPGSGFEIEPSSSEKTPSPVRVRTTSPSPSLPLPFPSDSSSSESSKSSRERPRFAQGTTGGVQPLDTKEFEGAAFSRRTRSHEKEKRVLIISGPAPMANSSRIVQRRFRVGLRDILLLALVALLGLGIWLGWQIYNDLKIRNDLKKFEQSLRIIEERKQEELKKVKPHPPSSL